MSSSEIALWHAAERQAAAGDLAEAAAIYERLMCHPDWRVPGALRLSVVRRELGQLQRAVRAAICAASGPQDEGSLAADVARQCVDLGEVAAGLQVIDSAVLQECDDVTVLLDVAQLLCDQSFPERALPLLERVAARGGRGVRFFHLMGLACSLRGDVHAADAAFEQCLRLQPDNAAVHYLLAGLHRKTNQLHHVDRLRAILRRLGPRHVNAALIQYALFKELDDLGDVEAAWSALDAGMRCRRAQVRHQPALEQALFTYLGTVVPSTRDASDQVAGPSPIFVVGLPRSGTTLLERMLGGHSLVQDAGELSDFCAQARVMVDCAGGPELDLDLARALVCRDDWLELGRRYLAHTQWRSLGRPFYTDKLPINYMHIGWIAKSLPRAKIVHLVREPMDVCFSNLKQLFAPGNSHSFDQLEMAGHYVRYRQLMDHWHQSFPGRILDVDYRQLVMTPDSVARQVLEFCSLPWQPGVVSIESRKAAVATASMMQVREPVHTRYLGQWQRYAKHLEPLQDALAAAGY